MKTLKIIGQVILYAVLCVLIFVVGYNFVSKVILKQQMTVLFGYSSAIVVSSSMYPTLQVNDYVIIHQQADYEVGDIICFMDDDMAVTHRVSNVEETDGVAYYYTKGDANDSEDLQPKTLDKIYGKVVWVMIGAGSVFGFFQSVWGIIVIFSAIGLIFFITLYVKSLRQDREQLPENAGTDSETGKQENGELTVSESSADVKTKDKEKIKTVSKKTATVKTGKPEQNKKTVIVKTGKATKPKTVK